VATTKRTRCQFKVKEGINDPFIDAEPCSGESHSENPGTDPDLLSFDLRSGISLDEAQRIADFMNEHLLSIARTKFGDVKDIAREAKQDLRIHSITEDHGKAVLEKTRASLRAEDVSGALENLKGVEAWGKNLLTDWKQVVKRWQFDV
jgi:hypothetical protein